MQYFIGGRRHSSSKFQCLHHERASEHALHLPVRGSGVSIDFGIPHLPVPNPVPAGASGFVTCSVG